MSILLADPDTRFADQILNDWSLNEVVIISTTNDKEVISSAEKGPFDCIFLATEFITVDGFDTISHFKDCSPGVEIIVLCDSKSLGEAEKSLSKGAHSYLMKPIGPKLLEDTAKKAITRSQSRQNYRLMEDHVLEDLLGQTPAMKKILKTLYKVAPTSSTLLITGESGTGKEFVSNIIHRLSKRAEEPFIAVNCGAIPENIVESELFGSKKGAYTGAIADKKGLFEEADRGTLFLDEVGELPPQTQVKLLRFLENREIRRVGDTESKHINVRIIAATNVNMSQAIEKGDFREDLFYRLNTFQVHLPPLRERKQTIPNLVKFFVLKNNQDHEREISGIDNAAQFALTDYNYPGNIRELSNAIEHAVVMAEEHQIRLEDLPERMTAHPGQKALPNYENQALSGEIRIELDNDQSDEPHMRTSNISGGQLEQTLEATLESDVLTLSEIEKLHIIDTLKKLGNNQTEVSKKLGISRSTLWRKLQDHEIEL